MLFVHMSVQIVFKRETLVARITHERALVGVGDCVSPEFIRCWEGIFAQRAFKWSGIGNQGDCHFSSLCFHRRMLKVHVLGQIQLTREGPYTVRALKGPLSPVMHGQMGHHIPLCVEGPRRTTDVTEKQGRRV